jgi:hypothetical protein
VIRALLKLVSLFHFHSLVGVTFTKLLDSGSDFLSSLSFIQLLLELTLFKYRGILDIKHIAAHFFVLSLLSIILVGSLTVTLNHGSIKLLFTGNCLSIQLVLYINTGLGLCTEALLVVSVVLVVSLFLEALHLNLVEHLFTFTS